MTDGRLVRVLAAWIVMSPLAAAVIGAILGAIDRRNQP